MTAEAGESRADPLRPTRRATIVAVSVVCMLGMLNYMDRMLLAAVLPSIKSEFSLSDSQLGLLSISFAIFYSVLGIPIARFADKGSRRAVIGTAAFFWSLMTAVCGLANSYIALFLSRIGVAVGEAGFVPATYSLLSDYFKPTHRNIILGLLNTTNSIGFIAGLSLGGLIAAHYGWRAAFLYLGAPGLLLSLCAFFLMQEPKRGTWDTAKPDASMNVWAALWALWQNKVFRWIAITSALNAFCAFGMTQWLPSFFNRTHHLDVGTVGVIFGTSFGLGLATGQFLGGLWASRLARTYIFRPLIQCVWTNAVSALCLLGVLWSPRTDVAIAFVMLACFISALGHAPQAAGAQNALPPSLRATGGSILGLGTSLVGLGFGPLVVGMLSDLFADTAKEDSLRWALSWGQALLFLASYAGWRAYREGLRKVL